MKRRRIFPPAFFLGESKGDCRAGYRRVSLNDLPLFFLFPPERNVEASSQVRDIMYWSR